MSFKRPKSKLSRLAVPLVVVLVALAAAGGAWGWQQKNLNQLSSQKKDLSAQVSSLTAEKDKLAAENKTLAQSANPPANTVYKASVGKFTLTLPNKYVVVHQQDQGRTGLPWLQIVIGEKTAAYNVTETPVVGGVTLSAILPENGNFRSYVDYDLSNVAGWRSPKKLPSLTIDGVAGEVYTDSVNWQGGQPKRIYLSKNGIVYIISLTEGGGNIAQQKLDAVVAGFKFN